MGSTGPGRFGRAAAASWFHPSHRSRRADCSGPAGSCRCGGPSLQLVRPHNPARPRIDCCALLGGGRDTIARGRGPGRNRRRRSLGSARGTTGVVNGSMAGRLAARRSCRRRGRSGDLGHPVVVCSGLGRPARRAHNRPGPLVGQPPLLAARHTKPGRGPFGRIRRRRKPLFGPPGRAGGTTACQCQIRAQRAGNGGGAEGHPLPPTWPDHRMVARFGSRGEGRGRSGRSRCGGGGGSSHPGAGGSLGPSSEASSEGCGMSHP